MTVHLNGKLALALAVAATAPWLIAASIGAAGARDDAGDTTRIDIVGTGTAPQAAQLLTMRAGVTSFDIKASRAVADNADAMAAIRSNLARYGIDPKEIRSGQFSLQPSSRSDESRSGDTIHGFEVRHQLSIVFRDIARTGTVMDTLVSAGANDISGPSFSTEATPVAQSVARQAAIRDADQRAQFYAKALGLRVKRVVTMRDSGGFAAPAAALQRFDVGPAATEISPGSDLVSVSVSAQYELTR